MPLLPWIHGSHSYGNGSGSGVFSFGNAAGSISSNASFREWFVNTWAPWFGRGWHLYLGSGTGITSCDKASAIANDYSSFRSKL